MLELRFATCLLLGKIVPGVLVSQCPSDMIADIDLVMDQVLESWWVSWSLCRTGSTITAPKSH